MLSRPRFPWQGNSPETAKILHRDICGFFLKDEEFVSKTINDSNIDLDRFHTSKVRQLVKKMGSSKATVRHIKQVAKWLPGGTNQSYCNTSTQISQQANTRKKSFVKPRPTSHKNDASDWQQVPSYHNNNYKKCFDTKDVYKNKERCQKCGDSIHIESFKCPAKKYQWKSCHKYGHLTSLCYQKKQVSFWLRKPKDLMLQVGAVYACDKSICGHPEDLSSSNEPFSLQVRIQHNTNLNVSRFPHNFT